MPQAVVPEHSRPLLEALSGGTTFEVDSHVFSAADDWLMAIGYPQEGEFSVERLEAALAEAVARTGASDCFVIAPELPDRLKAQELDSDVYYTLAADAPAPSALRRHVRRAREVLHVDETREFTAEHRRLWTEFMGRLALPPRIRHRPTAALTACSSTMTR